MLLSNGDEANKRANNQLEQHDLYILDLVYRYYPGENAYSERDELAQRSRIKLWQATLKRSLTHPKLYISRIVRSAYIDMCREYKAVFALPLNDEGELLKGTLLISCSGGMGDPQDELEREEALYERLDMLSCYVTRLPQQQRRAILLRLKKRVDNLSLLARYMRKYKVFIENVHSPVDKVGKQNLASSVAPALTKIDAFFKEMHSR